MLIKYLDELKNEMDKHSFLMIMSAVEDDIKFNRVRFNKVTPVNEFIRITEMSKKVVLRC